MQMGDRLRQARESAGFSSAREAAEALSIAPATYIQHENGTRNIPRDKAARYARFFRTTPEWILYGRGKRADCPLPNEIEMQSMVRDVLDELVTLDTRLVDLPRIVAPSLLEQIRRYQDDRAD